MERCTALSIAQCLDKWEFCPICNKRNKIDLGFYQNSDYSFITSISNDTLQISDPETQENILTIQLKDNCVSHNTQYFQPHMRISCKKLHWNITYSIVEGNKLYAYLDKLSFVIKDSKTKIIYGIISNYLTNKTNIQLSDTINTLQDFEQEIIPFECFDKTYLIKRIKTLCLLN